MVEIIQQGSTIHICNSQISYILSIRDGRLFHEYFGERIKNWTKIADPIAYKRSFCVGQPDFERPFDELPFEYPQDGDGDYRIDAFRVKDRTTGADFFDFRVCDIECVDNLCVPVGMPGIKKEGKTVKIKMQSPCGLRLTLFYGLCEEVSAIFRFQRLENATNHFLEIKKLASFSLELPAGNWQALTLAGTHLKEGEVQRVEVPNGVLSFGSRRGVSSSQHPPYWAIVDAKSGWNEGTAYGMSLLYSGSHEEIVEKDYYGQLRVQGGLHPDVLNWMLAPKEQFDTPQAILVYSKNGWNGMAQEFHNLYRSRLFSGTEKPILINSWESFYYDITQDKIEDLAGKAQEAGMEMVVIDDGWFRKENNSRAPIGDWIVNKAKLPDGLERAIEAITSRGMRAGLWFEPEAVSANSDLAAKHPEWILQEEGSVLSQGRHELLLDLSRKEVQDHVISFMDDFLTKYDISYVKWDMNRPLANAGKSGRHHAYVLGLYRVLDTVTSRHPDVIFEGCSSGGNRLDAGILAYVHQNWASDNTDPFDRIAIQSGLALFFPPQSLTAHVSASPNHQTGRKTSLASRFEVARLFNPGYEVDLGALCEKERQEISRQIKSIQADRKWMDSARFFQTDQLWAMVDSRQSRARVLIFQNHFDPTLARQRYLVPWLKEESIYRIEPLEIRMSGQMLRCIGVLLPRELHDYHVYSLDIVEEE